MKYQIRIISGSLRGRKIMVVADADLRPMADRAREALFNILGDAVPGRHFLDVFAGSGAVGLEALSRGASFTTFVERDNKVVADVIKHLEAFGVAKQAKVLKADAYRWADKWVVPAEPVNVFLGFPYKEFENHFDAVHWMVHTLQQRLPLDSNLIVQSDSKFAAEQLPEPERWDLRHYGRTQLAFWSKVAAPVSAETEVEGT